MAEQDRTIRLIGRSSPKGVFRIILELPESKLDECILWAEQAKRFSPDFQYRFEETTGRMIRIVDWFKRLLP